MDNRLVEQQEQARDDAIERSRFVAMMERIFHREIRAMNDDELQNDFLKCMEKSLSDDWAEAEYYGRRARICLTVQSLRRERAHERT